MGIDGPGGYQPNGLTKLLVSLIVVSMWAFIIYFRIVNNNPITWTEQLLTVTVIAVVARMHGVKLTDIIGKR